MSIKTFKRYELKFLIAQHQYHEICQLLKLRMSYDPFCKKNGSYMIYNIYFDTKNDDIIRHCISKPYYKEKLRLRSYKIPASPDEPVFLELKRKIGGIVAKRRAALGYKTAMEFVKTGISVNGNNYQDKQVANEIENFLTLKKLFPRVFISYERTAFFDNEDSSFRVSFDKNILTRRNNVDLISGNGGNQLLENGNYLMEVKCAGAIPLWMTTLLSSLKVYTTSFSKYGTEYKAYAKGQQKTVLLSRAF